MIDSTRRQQQRLRIGGATALKRFFHLSGRCRAGGAWLPPYRRIGCPRCGPLAGQRPLWHNGSLSFCSLIRQTRALRGEPDKAIETMPQTLYDKLWTAT